MRASTKGARRRAGRPSTSRPPIRRYHYVTDDPAALASRSGTVTVSTNSSVGPLQLELLPPKNAGFGRNWQLPMSSACLRHFGTRHRWMGAPGARGGGAFRDHAGGWVCGLRGWLVAALPLHELQQLATSTATLPGVSLPIPGCVPTKGASTATNAYWRASPGAAARPPPPPRPRSQPAPPVPAHPAQQGSSTATNTCCCSRACPPCRPCSTVTAPTAGWYCTGACFPAAHMLCGPAAGCWRATRRAAQRGTPSTPGGRRFCSRRTRWRRG